MYEIVVEKRPDDYIAYLACNPAYYGTGKTFTEAVVTL
jgi:hypothetical protein